jgi:hypothetical protein
MIALFVDLALIGTTFFLGLATWRLGTVAQRFLTLAGEETL